MQKLALLIAFGVFLSAVTLWAQVPPPSILADPDSDVFVTILDETSRPLAGASLTYSDWHNAPTFVSDVNGSIRLDRSLFTSLYDATFWITAPDFGSKYIPLGNITKPEEKVENKYTFRLSRHTHLEGTVLNIEGTVTDQKKQPIPDAKVDITYCRPLGKAAGPISTVSVTTDRNGRWVCDTIPGGVTILEIKPSHPDYATWGGGNNAMMAQAQTMEGSIHVANRSNRSRFLPDFTQVLKRGTDIAIRVIDESGKPVAGAMVVNAASFQLSGDPQSAFPTDADGIVKLKNWHRGPSHFIVKAQDFAPQGEKIDVAETPATYTFQMSRGHKLAIRVVDKNRQPVPGVQISLRTEEPLPFSSWWYDESIPKETDANGVLVWEHVPNKTANAHFWKDGYMQTYNVTIPPETTEFEYLMYKNLIVKGRVIDTNTKQPIERFNVILGVKTYPQHTDWSYIDDYLRPQNAMAQPIQAPREYPKGQFERVWPQTFESMFVRIKAPGYDLADSQVFRMGNEILTFNVELKPNPNIIGTVYRPDGTPAAGAEIAVGSKGNPVYLFNGRIDRKQTPVVVTANSAGRFVFPAVETGQYTLVAIHDAGYSIARQEWFDTGRTIRLHAFTEVTGTPDFPGRKISTLTFGKGGREELDGYFIDIAYDPHQDATAKSRMIGGVWVDRTNGQTSVQVPFQ